MTEHTVQGVVVTDSERILYANPAVRNLYGVPLGRVLCHFAELPAGLFCEHLAALPPDAAERSARRGQLGRAARGGGRT
jgi:PAS domain-containing protein